MTALVLGARGGRVAFRGLAWLLGGALAVFLLLPILALFWSITPADLVAGLAHPLVRPALALSLVTALASLFLVIVLGTPLAWLLAFEHGRAARVFEMLVRVPVVLPPAVAGLGLLLAFGRRGVLGQALCDGRCSLAFTSTAVVLAGVFVSAPFFVSAAVSAFRGLDPSSLVIARSLGASPARVFFRIALPVAAPGLAAGAAMSFARALGEFGATLMFAGSLPGRTQTLPLAIYAALESDLRAAQALSLVLLAAALTLLAVSRVRLSAPVEPRGVLS